MSWDWKGIRILPNNGSFVSLRGIRNLHAYLARSQDPADLPHDRFVTAEIRGPVKYEADIVSQVVPVVVSM